MLQTLTRFCDWLQTTPLSVHLQEVAWVVPAVQTVHILAIASLIGASMALSLYLLGLGARGQSAQTIAARYLPVIWWALPVLLLSGAVLIIAEPARSLKNPVFGLKMLLLLIASALTLVYQLPLRGDTAFWSATRARVATARAIGALSLGLWVGVIFAGRWIAYVEAL